jgi:HAD superfamily hydrolase (TIGR01662 family)
MGNAETHILYIGAVARTAAVFFDVDFTLIYPGPRFQGTGYQASCARHGIHVDPAGFEAAVAGAAPVLDTAGDAYDPNLYVAYTRRIVELMGGTGPGLDAVAREIYDDWNEHHHFSLYDDVPEALAALKARGLRLGLISNSQRCLVSFQEHFELAGLISVAVSSSIHGFMKPHRSIFQAALSEMQVEAREAVMVGDSLLHDVLGAARAGMRGVLLARGGPPDGLTHDVPVIHSLVDLPHAI